MVCPSCQTAVDGSQKFCPSCGAILPAPSQSADPLVGSVLAGKYRIVKLLGEGGMGCVYLGEQQMGTTLRKVAVKTLHRHLSQDDHIKARFQRECGTVASLEHPNTIQIYDFGQTPDGILYIVMEFVNGRSVADVLEKDGPMEPERVLRILTQVCGSLEEAHGRGIVHRDLKPDNVVLCERAGQKDWVEVLDFGIAKRSSEHDPNEAKLTQQGMVLGTPPYMSPEQFTGKPIDARSDIYSLGVMVYEMLTGRLPFSANTAWEWASQHMTQSPLSIDSHPNSSRIPEAMRRTITKALEKAPESRFQNVREFIDALGGKSSVVAVGGGVAAPMTREKTQMGEPLMPPMGMAPPASGGGAGVPAPAAPAYVPPPPPRETTRGGGGGKSPMIPILAVAGVVCLALVGLALTKPWAKKKEVDLSFDAGGPVVTAPLEPTKPTTDTVAHVEDAGAIPPLGEADLTKAAITKPAQQTGNSRRDAGSVAAAAKDGGVIRLTPKDPGKPEPPKPEPPICATARFFQNRPNMVAEFNKARDQCIAQGGKL